MIEIQLRRSTVLADYDAAHHEVIVRGEGAPIVHVGAPWVVTPGTIQAEVTRIDHAIQSLDDDVRGQLSWRAPGTTAGKFDDGSGYDSGFIPDPSADPKLAKGFGPVADSAMLVRDKGKSKEKLAAERGFGAKWAAFVVKWAAWVQDATAQPSSIPRDILLLLGAQPVGGSTGAAPKLGTRQAWDELNTFTSEYQQFRDMFVKLGGKPTLAEAKTPDQKKADEDKKDPLIPWWVWVVGAGVLVVGVGLYLAPSIIASRVVP